MPEVVCNTTPLQYLHQADVLWILPVLYGKILIPRAVADEIGAGLNARVRLPDITSLDWIEVREVHGTPWPVPRDIHRGEAEVIALAGSLSESKMILDDLAARRHARLLGLKLRHTSHSPPGSNLQSCPELTMAPWHRSYLSSRLS